MPSILVNSVVRYLLRSLVTVQAIVDVLFGDYNPAGRLPYTILKDDSYMLPTEVYLPLLLSLQ